MITVNLLPGAGGKSTSSPGMDMGALLSGATAGIKDKFLIGAAASVSLSVAVVALLFMSQAARERTLVERERRAVEDSTRFKVVLAAKAKAEATRDSLYQQVAIIKSIDASRYLWPHLLDEISSSLPPYTWLTSVTQTSAPPSSVAQDSASLKATASGKAVSKKPVDAKTRKAHADSVLAVASRATKFRIVGHTVDIQALTLFMKTLEASPFIQNVQLTRSDMVTVDQKEVTEFQLEAESQSPPPFLIKSVSLAVGGN
jgi:Tfp pilus assembly protein PilN